MKDPIGIEQKADSILQAVQNAQQEAEIKNAAIRQAERQAKFDAWIDPIVMAHRKAVYEKCAIESLMALKVSGQADPMQNVPIPPANELPKEMQNQQPSTIRTWMWTQKKYRDLAEQNTNAEQERLQTIRKNNPELFGIDYTKLREENNVVFGTEHKVMSGATPFHLKTFDKAYEPSVEKPSEGFVARMFAGMLNRKK